VHKVAREYVPAWHAPILVEQLAAPPPVLGRSGDSDDIVRLEIELFRNRRGVVVKCPYYIGKPRKSRNPLAYTSSRFYSRKERIRMKRTVEQHAPSVISVLARWRIRNGLRLRLRERHRLRRRAPVHRTGAERPVPASSVCDLLLMLVLLIRLSLLLRWLRVRLVRRSIILRKVRAGSAVLHCLLSLLLRLLRLLLLRWG
jgi:hypothetical protein